MAAALNSGLALEVQVLQHAVILLVEDRADDVLIIAKAFAEARLDNEVRVQATRNRGFPERDSGSSG